MSELSYLEKLLDGVEVEWLPLGIITTIKTGQPVNKNMISENPGKYPVINSGREPLGFINNWNTDNDPIGITTRGAGVGSVTWQDGKYFRGNLNYSVTINKEQSVSVRYLYHLLLEMQKDIQELCTFDGIPALNSSNLKKLLIPIPCPDQPEKSLAIQSEIVCILDKFTVYTAGLTAELTARKKQYNYYCDQLLNFDGNIPIVQLSDCCVSISDGDHQAPPKTDSGVPFITISNVTNSNTIDFENTYFVSDDYYQKIHDKRRARKKDILYTVVGSIGIPVYIDFDMKFAFQRHIAILRIDEQKIISKYLYHVMRSSDFLKKANSIAVGAAQKTITLSALNKMNVPIPPIGEQERIVNILDKFDILANSLSEGLPREIELRQKQYEYYRGMLFSFPKLEVAEA
jgi:type I restriction enzyme S subunit